MLDIRMIVWKGKTSNFAKCTTELSRVMDAFCLLNGLLVPIWKYINFQNPLYCMPKMASFELYKLLFFFNINFFFNFLIQFSWSWVLLSPLLSSLSSTLFSANCFSEQLAFKGKVKFLNEKNAGWKLLCLKSKNMNAKWGCLMDTATSSDNHRLRFMLLVGASMSWKHDTLSTWADSLQK